MDAVAVVADDARQAGLPQLLQLSESEANGRLVALVPEAISKAQVTESGRYYVPECRAHVGPSSVRSTSEVLVSFEDATHEQVDVFDFIVHFPQGQPCARGKEFQVGKTANWSEAKSVQEGAVRGQTMLSTSLDVQGREVPPRRAIRSSVSRVKSQYGSCKIAEKWL